MKQSAGIVLYREHAPGYQVLLVHPGGSFWSHKDKWSIPKGELDEGEEVLAAAFREFQEELGVAPPAGELIDLGSIKDGVKTNSIWALAGEIDLTKFVSNSFSMEWPPHSGVETEFPENDRADWFSFEQAKQKLFNGQVGFIDRLAAHLGIVAEEAKQGGTDDAQQSLL